MYKKKILRKSKRSRNGIIWQISFILFPVLLAFLMCAGWLVYYQSRAVPNLADDDQMTTMPPGISNVLGTDSTSNTKTNPGIRVPILMYHYVEYVHNDPGKQNLDIPPNILTAQIEALKDAGYTFINTRDLTKAISGYSKLPQKVVILTFDDGYMDLYTDVLPILEKENVKAVAYIVPNLLDRPNYLSTQQLEEVAKSPLVEIGAHTMNHYALAGMNTTEATYEIVQSRKVLQNLLKLPVRSFAYPYGSFDDATIRIVKKAGFTNAVSVIPGIIQTNENEFFLFRLRPGYRTGHVLTDYLAQDTFQPW